MTKKEYIERYGEESWKRMLIKQKTYREAHREEQKAYREAHREERKTYSKIHRDCLRAYRRKYHSTQRGRANMLLAHYRQMDRKVGRGDCTLTTDWILNNVFTSSCTYCGESDWRKLGADRIDNSKPHTPDNVVCACGICNTEKSDRYSVEEFKEYRKTHLRSCDFLKSIKPEIVSVDGIKVIRKRK